MAAAAGVCLRLILMATYRSLAACVRVQSLDCGSGLDRDQIRVRWQEKLTRLHAQAKVVQTRLEHSSVTGSAGALARPEGWKVFCRQQQAFDEARDQIGSAVVFCFQDPEAHGRRKYLTSTYASFWEQYRHVDPDKRHFYEVIPEGFPCKLYFDIEYMKEWNRHADALSMMLLFKEYVVRELLAIFGVRCDLSDIVDLDSSSETKFSRHLIFNLKDAFFRDNVNVGLFVRKLIDELHIKLPDRYQELMVAADERGGRKVFVDEAVYTKNRTFRIYLSSKYEKSEVLWPAAASNAPDPSGLYEFFLKSLVCSVAYDDRMSILAMDKNLALETSSSKNASPLRAAFPKPDLARNKMSPFPRLDGFILELINDRRYHAGTRPATIRSCVYFSEGKILVYYVSGNRYCDKIGRNHRSNHVQIVCYFNDGYYVRKCFDPDCRSLPATYHPLPFDCLPLAASVSQFDDDPYLLDDANLLALPLAHAE